MSDIDQLSPANALQNAQRAIQTANIQFEIPVILDAEDIIADPPDELSIMTYLSYFREYDSRQTKEKG